VLPHHGLHPDRTVADHLTFPLLVGGLPLQARRRRLRDVAEQLALGGLLDHLPHELTPSERQRVAFGRAIARRPEVLLVDEPWSGLAGPDRDLVRDECARRCAELTATIVAVVHDPADAHVIADRVVTIDSGVARPEHPVRMLA
jgi:multiple sugar transport system ATP-binding protein